MAETIFGDLLEPHTLIAAINDPSLDVPKQFLLSNFFGAPEATENEVVDIYRRSDDRGLALFIAGNKESNVIEAHNTDFLGSYRFPYTSEKIPVTNDDIKKARSADDLYRTSPLSIAERKALIIQKYIARLKARAQRRVEWMAAQFLTTGILTYQSVENGVAIKMDLGISSTYLPTLSGTSRWGESGADIAGNLGDWANAINSATGGYGGRLIMGSTAAKLFESDPKVRADYANINIDVGRMLLNGTAQAIATAGTQKLGTYRGFTPEVYQETYKDDGGTTVPYFPANGVLLMGSTFVGHQLYGLNMINGNSFGDPFYSDSHEEWDPDVLWIRGRSRPLPLPEQEGSWVFATVADA